jgi:hypothetical protein
MSKMKTKTMIATAVIAAALAAAGAASAAGVTASLFGGAVAESGDVSLTSDLTDVSTANDFSGIKLTVPAGTTFAQLATLSTDFNTTVGGCGGGSPRFSIQLASGKNVFVYLGPSPNFTGCTLNTWQSTGNLIGNNDVGRYDTSQVQPGTQSSTYAAALALVGSQQVTEIDLVVDSGWFFTPKVQTVLVRNVNVNGQVFYAPESGGTGHGKSPAQACKAELKALGLTAFEQKYGRNHNLRNAFGKCVSSKKHQAKAQHTAKKHS